MRSQAQMHESLVLQRIRSGLLAHFMNPWTVDPSRPE